MSFLAPEGWTRCQGYPQFRKGNQGGFSVVEKYYTTWDIRAVMLYAPAIGSAYDPSSDQPALYGLRLQDIAFSPSENREYAYIDLTFAPNTGGGSSGGDTPDGEPVFVLDGATIDKPIETRTGYKTCWNYHLAAKSGTTDTPAWWSTATDTTLSDANALIYAWVKDDPPAPGSDGLAWKILVGCGKTKPGTESYIVPAPVVNEQRWYTDKAAADAAAALVDTRGTPGDTKGRAGGEWLRMANRLSPDGKRWLLEQPWQWALSWDHDLYD